MPDRADSTPLPSLACSSTFRETFLWRFESMAHVQGLEAVGDLLWEYLNELHQWGPDEGPLTYFEVRAAGREIEAVSAYLEEVYRDREACSMSNEEDRIARKAGKWASKARKLASEIKAALPPLPSELPS